MKQITSYFMFDLNYLTPEQQSAFDIFLQYRTNLHGLLHHINAIKSSPLPTNFVAASYQPFKKSKLPREKHWSWNQSNSKVSITFDEQTIILRKISPRKRSKVTKSTPSYKIWLYHIQAKNLPDQYFLWCEKGVDSNEDYEETLNLGLTPHYSNTAFPTSNTICGGIQTSIGVIYPERISLDSLSFLQPFVDTSTAVELGWQIM